MVISYFALHLIYGLQHPECPPSALLYCVLVSHCSPLCMGTLLTGTIHPCIPPCRNTDASFSGGGGDGSGSDSALPNVSKPPSPNRSQSRFESNVFARLTSNLVQAENTGGESQYKGHFRRSDSRTRNAGGPLICSHIAEGHKGEVLSVCATDHHLFSASKGESRVIHQAVLSQDRTDSQLQLCFTDSCMYTAYASVCVHVVEFCCSTLSVGEECAKCH